MKVGKIKVMRWSNNGNGARMHVILKGEQLGEVDCIKYLASQVATDRGCERDVVRRMNEVYRVLKSVLNNRGLRIKDKNYLYEGVIVPTALCGSKVWGMRSAERRNVIMFLK